MTKSSTSRSHGLPGSWGPSTPTSSGWQELWSKPALEAALKDQYDVLAEPATGETIVCAALVRKGLLAGTDTRDVYYTHVHQDLRESLDHVLVSEQFYDNSRRCLWLFDGLVINNDHLNFDNHKETGTGVVKVSFLFNPA